MKLTAAEKRILYIIIMFWPGSVSLVQSNLKMHEFILNIMDVKKTFEFFILLKQNEHVSENLDPIKSFPFFFVS